MEVSYATRSNPLCARAHESSTSLQPNLKGVWRGVSQRTIGGPNDGLTRQLNGADITIGSGEQCDLVLADDAYVSRRHVRVSSDDNAMVMVEDLASSNGTLLRIRRPIMLEPGDEILIGTAVLRLESSNKSGD